MLVNCFDDAFACRDGWTGDVYFFEVTGLLLFALVSGGLACFWLAALAQRRGRSVGL